MLRSNFKGLTLSVLLLSISLLGLTGGAVKAQQESTGSAAVQADTQATFTVDWKNRDLEVILKFLRDRTGLNIYLEKPEFNTRVTLRLTNVQYGEILQQIAERHDLYVEKLNSSNFMLTKPQKVTLNMVNAPLGAVLMKVAKETNTNIIMSSAVTNKYITVNLAEVPYPDALDIILKNEGLAFVRERRGIIRVTSRDVIKAEKETRIYPLAYYTPGGLRYTPKISSPWVTMNDEGGGSVVSKGTGDVAKEEKLEEGGAGDDAKKKAPAKSKSSATGVSLVDSIQNVLSPEGVVYYNRENNLLVLTDSPIYLDRAEKIIKAMDIRPPQILLDCKIVSFNLEEVNNKGLDWVNGISVSAGAAGIRGILFPFHRGTPNANWRWLPSGGVTDPGAGSFVNTGTLDFSATQLVLTFLGTLNSTELIQAPNVTTLDNTEAAIRVGRDIRYAEGVVETTDTGTLVTYKEAKNSPINTGIHLVVIPHVTNKDGDILLTVIPKVEDFVRFEVYGSAPTEVRLPITDSKIVITRMIVKDGHTGVIGGLIEDSVLNSKHYIPGLHRIPVAGWLFKNKNRTTFKRSTVLFITPRIVKSGDMTLIDQKIQEVKNQLGDLKNFSDRPVKEDGNKKVRFGKYNKKQK